MRIVVILCFAGVFAAGCRNGVRPGGGVADSAVRLDPVTLARMEDSNRRYFADSFAYRHAFGLDRDSTGQFSYFLKRRYPNLHPITTKHFFDPIVDEFIYAFKEEFVDRAHVDSSRQWLRIIVMPSFGTPYCLVLENQAGRSLFTFRITNGSGGYFTGELLLAKQTVLDDTFAPKVFKTLDSLGYWKLDEEKRNGGLDGTEWCFEGLDKGRYKRVYRWMPDNYGDDTTRCLGKIGVSLEQEGHFFDYLMLGGKEIYKHWK